MGPDTKSLLNSLREEKEKIVSLSHGGNGSAVNLVHLRSFTGGDIEKERMLFDLFEKTAEQSLRELHDVLNDNADTWKDSAHRLKGAAANLGAEKLANLCQKAEKLESIDEQEQAFEGIEAAVNDVLDHLRGLLV